MTDDSAAGRGAPGPAPAAAQAVAQPAITPPAAAASPARGRLLELLRSSAERLDVYQLAARTGLHITTVRFHLGVLVDADLVTVDRQQRTSPGRPRMFYGPVDRPPSGYHAVAAVLAANFGGTAAGRRSRAEQAGRDWAAVNPDPGQARTLDEVADRVTELFDAMNFDPEQAPVDSERQRVIRLRACPYRDIARSHPEVICSLHLGLLRGTLTRLGSPPELAGLVPFAEPGLCLATLTAAAD